MWFAGCLWPHRNFIRFVLSLIFLALSWWLAGLNILMNGALNSVDSHSGSGQAVAETCLMANLIPYWPTPCSSTKWVYTERNCGGPSRWPTTRSKNLFYFRPCEVLGLQCVSLEWMYIAGVNPRSSGHVELGKWGENLGMCCCHWDPRPLALFCPQFSPFPAPILPQTALPPA